jgi:metal-sulfur cluster biosynthetic enzyme
LTQEAVRNALSSVIDPELGIDVVELGLIYSIQIDVSSISVEMTMTSPACPLGEYLVERAECSIREHCPEVAEVSVTLVWDPPWTPARMGALAKQQLGWGD